MTARLAACLPRHCPQLPLPRPVGLGFHDRKNLRHAGNVPGGQALSAT